MRRRSLVLLSAASAGLITGVIACSPGVTQPSGTIPVPVADGKPCVEPSNIPVATTPPGTDAAGSTLPPGTIAKPAVSMPVGQQPPTELKITDITVGTGAEAKEGDTVTVDFTGVACSTGKQFVSSYDQGEPLTAPLATASAQNPQGFPQGMVDGIKGMKVGGRRQMIIPTALAYGDKPLNDNLLPGEAIVVVVDLKNAETPPPTTTTTAAVPTTTVPPSESPGSTAAPSPSPTAK
jgi:peptidylprolyl isomerase